MNRTLPLHTVYELRSVATQAALDALAILQPRGQRDAPLGSSHCLGVQAQDIMLTPIVRFASHMTSGARDDYGSPLAIAGADDMALYELVERHRTAMNLRQSEMMWVVHYRDAVGLIALERAKAARTRRDLLFHAQLLVPAARSCADAIGRHDQFRATARSWLAVLHMQNVDASAGLTCPNVDQLLDPAPPARQSRRIAASGTGSATMCAATRRPSLRHQEPGLNLPKTDRMTGCLSFEAGDFSLGRMGTFNR